MDLYEEVKNLYPGLKLKKLKEVHNRYLEIHAFDKSQEVLKEQFLKLILNATPFAYILNESFFFNANYYIDSRVLIPRFESEILVELVLKKLKKNDDVLEVGAGSGALSLSILKELNFPISLTASDIDQGALDVTQSNYHLHRSFFHKEHSFQIVKSDLLNAWENVDKKFDLIFSNPPYIKKSESNKSVHQQVDEFEPHLALYLEDDEYDLWFKRFFEQVIKHLRPGGVFLMEGHESELKQLSEKLTGNTESLLHCDYTDRYRFLEIKV